MSTLRSSQDPQAKELQAKEVSDTIAQPADFPFTETFDTLYYRRQIEPEKIRTVLQAHAEGSSLRGVSRIANLAYNTVVTIVRAASVKGQMIHNAHVQHIETTQITGDEFWSFVQKNKNTVSSKSESKETVGLE